jgi:hypothetical protein
MRTKKKTKWVVDVCYIHDGKRYVNKNTRTISEKITTALNNGIPPENIKYSGGAEYLIIMEEKEGE